MANLDTQLAQTVNDNITELIESVTEAYLHPPANTSDKNGRMCLYLLADRFSISPIKARKLLITSGAYKTPLSEYIGKLFRNGKTVKEIQNLTGLCAASVSGYLPYRKTVYNLESTTKYVEHLRRYRRRKALTHKLKTSISALDIEHTKDVLSRGRRSKSGMRRCSRTEKATLPNLCGWRWARASSRRSTGTRTRKPPCRSRKTHICSTSAVIPDMTMRSCPSIRR